MKLQQSIKTTILACSAFALIGCLGLSEDAKDALSGEEKQEVDAATTGLDAEEKKDVDALPDNCKVLFAKADKAERDASVDKKITDEEKKAIEMARGEFAEKCFDHLGEFDFPDGDGHTFEQKNDGEKDDGPELSDRCEAILQVDKQLFIDKCLPDVIKESKTAAITAGACEDSYNAVWGGFKDFLLAGCDGDEKEADANKCEPIAKGIETKVGTFAAACPNADAEKIFPIGDDDEKHDDHDEHDDHDDFHDKDGEHQDPSANLSEECKVKLESSVKAGTADAAKLFIEKCGEEYMPVIPKHLEGTELSASCKEGYKEVQKLTITNLITKCDDEQSCFVNHQELLKDCAPETTFPDEGNDVIEQKQ